MMNGSLFILLFCFINAKVFGQSALVSSEMMTKKETELLFTDSLKVRLDITYPIFRVYRCTDLSGEFFIVLTESTDSLTPDHDTLNGNIRAFNLRGDTNEFTKTWEINDFILNQSTGENSEKSIWFWTKYCSFSDLDKDGLIDPLIIYGTSGWNHTSDGRIKILLHYKGQKIAIRHQNGVLDFQRNTQVDQSFYTLPDEIQVHIKGIMKNIMDDKNAIFPYGWEKAMQQRKLQFDEK